MNTKKSILIIIVAIFATTVFLSVGAAVSFYTASYMKASSDTTEKETYTNAKKEKPKPKIEEKTATNIEKEKKVNPVKIYNLGLTEVDFRGRFNNIASHELSELNIRLDRDYVYNGTYANVYQCVFDSANSLVVSYEPNSELLRGVLLTGTGTSQYDTVTFLGIIAGIVASLNPELSTAERKELLQELGMFNPNGTDYKHINGSAYRNNTHYKIQGTNGNGIMFFATAKDIETHGGSSVKRDSSHNIVADVTNYIVWDAQNQQSMPKQETSSTTVATENNAGQEMGIADAYAAESNLSMFHHYITTKNYRGAYDYMTPNLQQKIPYDGWAQGFRTTVTSSVSDFDVISQTSDKIVLTYRLRAEDNPGGIQYFNGTAVFVKYGYDWKIDDITNKKI